MINNAKGLQHLFELDRADQANGPKSSTKKATLEWNCTKQYFRISVASDDLDKQIDDLMLTNELHLVPRSITINTNGVTSYDKDNANKQIYVL